MTPEETFGQLLGLGKAWRVVEARLEASSSTFLLKVEEAPHLWPEESTRAGTPVNLPRPCRADAVAAPQLLQQGVRDRLCPAAGTP
jgi:hypothetical protein